VEELIINPERRISLMTGDINEERRKHVPSSPVGSDWLSNRSYRPAGYGDIEDAPRLGAGGGYR
jgi:hypothetical protein